jgi:hypothetical protein
MQMIRLSFNLIIVVIQIYLLIRAVVVFFEAGLAPALVFVMLAAAFSLAKCRAPEKAPRW